MKTIIPVLALALALAPCTFAQEEAPAPQETATTGSAYEALTAEQKAEVDAIVDKCAQTTETFKTLLSGIKDRKTADAAAPKLKAAMDQLDAAWDALPPELWPAVQERIQSQKEGAKEVQDLIMGLLQQNPPFFASIALASALGEVEVQNVNIQPPTEEGGQEEEKPEDSGK